MRVLTGQEKAGECNDIELLDGHVIVVHEEVQQVDGQMARCGTQLVAVTEDGQQVGKVAPHANLGRVGMVDRQLQFLKGRKLRKTVRYRQGKNEVTSNVSHTSTEKC